MNKNSSLPWYAGEHQDTFFYLMIAIFFIELVIGGVAFFYGIMHAAPEVPGGAPMARFPWLAWIISAILGPVLFLLIVHIAGTLVSRSLKGEEKATGEEEANSQLPPRIARFYATVRHAPAIVVLLTLLLAGASLFFVDGAIGALGSFAQALVPYIPWIAVSAAVLLGMCFLIHAILIYRQRKMENEYAWRREVLNKTGVVLVDKSSLAISDTRNQTAIAAVPSSDKRVLDITPKSLDSGKGEENSQESAPVSDNLLSG